MRATIGTEGFMTPFEQQEAILDQEAERSRAAGIDIKDTILPDADLDLGI